MHGCRVARVQECVVCGAHKHGGQLVLLHVVAGGILALLLVGGDGRQLELYVVLELLDLLDASGGLAVVIAEQQLDNLEEAAV